MPEHVHLLVSEPVTSDLSKVMQVLKQKTARELLGTSRAGYEEQNPEKPAPLKTKGAAPEEFGKNQTIGGRQKLIPRKASGEDEAFWMRRFYDFNVWNPEKVKEKLDCVHANPIERKLVGHPGDWPWSSWSHYAKAEAGLIRIDPPIRIESFSGCGSI